MNFDEIVDRRGTHSAKWDMMEPLFGVPAEDGLAMWVADMDFRPPDCINRALRALVDHGFFGYFGDDSDYRASIGWWLKTRHGWEIEPDWIFTTHGLVNGTAVCVDTFTAPGDHVVMMTPIYHAFFKILAPADRPVTECQMVLRDGRYEMDFDAWDAQMTGREKMLILCSPHNPGGRVWTREELEGVAAFARRHDLIVVSDEIHNDLVLPGHRHTPMALIEGIADRLIMMTSTTKTFNIAGAHLGNVIIPDPELRAAFGKRMAALGLSPNAFGMHMVPAAYSEEGAAWVDALMEYIAGNCRLFDEAVNGIPGLRSMPLEGTYLAWVDFTGTGMSREEYTARVEKDARIAVNHGTVFGKGGDGFHRFNLATQRSRVAEACDRLQAAFADLQ